MADERPTVVVTGFGPFGLHQINTSWVAVQELPNTDLAQEVNLVIKEIPVEYMAVDEHWFLHYGIKSSQSSVYMLVFMGLQTAFYWRYAVITMVIIGQMSLVKSAPKAVVLMAQRVQVENLPGEMSAGGSECLFTSLDLDRVCSEVMTAKSPCLVGTSDDAGRFLCDYTYYKSLHLGQGRGTVAFIHVPRVDSPYSIEELVVSLRLIILAMLRQLN